MEYGCQVRGVLVVRVDIEGFDSLFSETTNGLSAGNWNGTPRSCLAPLPPPPPPPPPPPLAL